MVAAKTVAGGIMTWAEMKVQQRVTSARPPGPGVAAPL
jgi:hypothetical protein